MSRPRENELQLIPARKGVAAMVRRGQLVKVINTHGKQVIDTWAFNSQDLTEHLSMEHTRASLRKVNPRIGDTLVSNHRVSMLKFTEDTTPGVHDTLFAACDVYRYKQMGAIGYHDNCTDNLHKALEQLEIKVNVTPCPLNLFMNAPLSVDGSMGLQPSASEKGQYVVLEAQMDLIVVFSACPQDMILDMVPTEAHFEIF